MLYKGMLTCWLSLACGSTMAQPGTAEATPEKQFQQQVHSIESFINRFNYQEEEQGNILQETAGGTVTEAFVQQRNQSIKSLFNNQHFKDSSRKQLLESFLSDVNCSSRQLKLDFYDQGWYAEVKLEAQYRQKTQPLRLILQTEEIKPKTSSWVIRAAKADFLDITPKARDSNRIIPPNSHGTDFMSIPGDLADPESVALFVARAVQPDVLSMFLYAVLNRELTLKKATQVTFHFLQLEGWILRVAEFNGEGTSTGWLVDELIRADPPAKRLYAAQQLNIR